MSKNIKNSPLYFLSGAIQALGAYDWGGKRLVIYTVMFQTHTLTWKIQWKI